MNITIFHGKIHYKWWFSIAMLNYQRCTSEKMMNQWWQAGYDWWCCNLPLLDPKPTNYLPHFPPNISHSTPHSTLRTKKLHTLHCTVDKPHLQSTLYTQHFTIHTPHFSLHTLHFTFATRHSTVFTPFHTPQSTLVQSYVQDCWNNFFHTRVLWDFIRVRWLFLNGR